MHDRWEAFAELETLIYGLHDSYHTLSEAAGPQGSILMSDAISEKCKLASEEHHKFLGALYVDDRGRSSKAKLLSFLETDSIPVRDRIITTVLVPSLLCLDVPSALRRQYQRIACCSRQLCAPVSVVFHACALLPFITASITHEWIFVP